MARQGEHPAGTRGPVEAAALFPRLHVSNSKKGSGPRPPPRNKMALYEQVTLPKAAAAAAAASAGAASQQEEVSRGGGMQAPRARTQVDGGNLPSMSSYGSLYDYPQHSMPQPSHLAQTSAPNYYPPSNFQSRSATGSQGTALRLPSGASSVGSASEWDAPEAQTAPAGIHMSQIVPGVALAKATTEAPGRWRQGEEEGCVVPSFQTRPLPRAESASAPPAHDVSGRWAWWSWQQQQQQQVALQRPQGMSAEVEEQSKRRGPVPASGRALYAGQMAAESAGQRGAEHGRKGMEAEGLKTSAASEELRAQRLALQKQAAADWKSAAGVEASGDQAAASERQLDMVVQQAEASQHQADLDSEGAANEAVAAAERRAGAMNAQQEVDAQIRAALESQSEGEKQGLVSEGAAGLQDGSHRLQVKPNLSIEVPETSTQTEGEPAVTEPANAQQVSRVNAPLVGGSERPLARQCSSVQYGFHKHFQSVVQPPQAKGKGDSSPEVIEGSDRGEQVGFKGGEEKQKSKSKVAKGAEGQGHGKSRKRASAQANKATQEAAAAVAAKAGPSPSGSSSGERSGGAGDGALYEQDLPSVCDGESNGADSKAEASIQPKDVVSVIGQHGFWKTRKAMQQQQKKFSAQLFEMHRLVKVQKMFAENPELTAAPSVSPSGTKRLHPRCSRYLDQSATPTTSDVRRGPFSLPKNSGSVSHADAFKQAKTSEFSNPGSTRYVASKVAQISTQYGPRDAVMAAQEAARMSFQEVSSATVNPVNVQAAEALALVAQRVGESCSKLMAHRAESEKSGGGAQAPSAEESGAQVVLEEATRLSATLEAMRPHLQGGAASAAVNPWLQNAMAGAYSGFYPPMNAFASPYLNPAMYVRQAQSLMAGYPSYDSSSASFFGGEAMSAPAGGANPYGSGSGYLPMYPKYNDAAALNPALNAALNPALNPWMQNADPMTAAWLSTMAGGVSPWGFSTPSNPPAGMSNTPAGFPNLSGYAGAGSAMGPTPSHSNQSMPFQASWGNFRGAGDEFSSGAGDAFSYEQYAPRGVNGRENPTQSLSGLSHSWAGMFPGSSAQPRFNLASQSSDAHAESLQETWSEQTFSVGGRDAVLGKRKEADANQRWSSWQQQRPGAAEDSFREGSRGEMPQTGSFYSQSHRMKGGGKDSDEDAAMGAPRQSVSQFYSSPDLSDEGGPGDGSKGVNELQLFPVKASAERKGAAAPIKVVPRAASETPDLGVSILNSIQRER